MGNFIPESELILHPDGSIYHLKLLPGQLADTVILVGDPQRVEAISSFFDVVEHRSQNREIITHTGMLGNKRLSVISTGMGPDNIDIVINELDALVNINLETREPKEKHTSLRLIRLGTSGALQEDIPVNSFILSEYGLGLDGLIYFYSGNHSIINREMTAEFILNTSWNSNLPAPYIVGCSSGLASLFSEGFLRGITATAPGFYGPQGRVLRLALSNPDMLERIRHFKSAGKKVLNFEMETSALYGLSKLLGHEALTICIAVANRYRNDINRDYKNSMRQLIEKVLDTLTQNY